MNREQYIKKARTLRDGSTICNVLEDKHGRRYAASVKIHETVNLAKKEVRRKIKAGMPGCVVLQRGESFPPPEYELPPMDEKLAA